jgi:chromosome segregation ATPase
MDFIIQGGAKLSSPLEKLRAEIITRIIDLEYSDEQHMNEIMELEIKVNKLNEKRKKVSEHLFAVKKELEELDQFVEWKQLK